MSPYSWGTFQIFTKNCQFCKKPVGKMEMLFLSKWNWFFKVSLNLMFMNSLSRYLMVYKRKICPLKPWIITVPHYSVDWPHTLETSKVEVINIVAYWLLHGYVKREFTRCLQINVNARGNSVFYKIFFYKNTYLVKCGYSISLRYVSLFKNNSLQGVQERTKYNVENGCKMHSILIT